MRTLAIIPLAAVFSSLGACVVYDHSDDNYVPPPPPPPVVNYAPYVDGAEAGVYWDAGLRDDIWYFDAVADDPDGVYDVTEVWADVYDDYTGEYLESFELYPTNDPYRWYSDWLGSSTWLDPFYTGYSVDFVAYDSYGETGYATVWAYSY